MIFVKAGTMLIFTSAPAVPPISIPIQMTSILFGNIYGAGPVASMAITNKNMPIHTSFGKFLFLSGIEFKLKDVIVKVTVSIAKMRPTMYTFMFICSRWICMTGSLEVSAIRLPVIQRAVVATGVCFNIEKKLTWSF